jgi:hypothetical protein
MTREELAKALQVIYTETDPETDADGHRLDWLAAADRAIELIGHPAQPAVREIKQMFECRNRRYALCYDGTFWHWNDDDWQSCMRPIPQPRQETA